MTTKRSFATIAEKEATLGNMRNEILKESKSEK